MLDFKNPFLQRSKSGLIFYGCLLIILGLLLTSFLGVRMLPSKIGLLLLGVSGFLIAATIFIYYHGHRQTSEGQVREDGESHPY